MMPDADKIMVAGDWHGNARWAQHAIREGLQGCKVILQLGDFGIWPGCQPFLDAVTGALEEQDARLFFIDGNHEDFGLLAAYGGNSFEPTEVTPRIWHLPRGCRWTWHDRTWVALGGAASVDRAFRAEGRSWFREEEITLLQGAMVALAGTADVMVTHECPRKVARFLPLGPPMPGWDTEVSRSHQELLDRIIDHVEPSWLFHGHMHLAHQGTFAYPHGKVQVRGLNCDGRDENWAILDTRLMAWEEDEEAT